MEDMLSSIRVLDFSNNIAGPLAASIFADFGAEVVKIERPVVGADERHYGLQLENGVSLMGAWLNRGKKSVTLDLRDPRAIALLEKMLPDFDVVIEGSRPGVMDKLGLGYERVHALCPHIVYCSISAYGQKGPYAQRPGYDLIAQAYSGMMDITGEPDGSPMKHGETIADYVTATIAYGAILTALFSRLKTGKGQHIDASLGRSMVFINSKTDYASAGLPAGRTGNHHSTMCPYGLFRGRGQQSIIIAILNQSLWVKLCGVMGKPELAEDPRFNNTMIRVQHKQETIKLIEDWLQGFEDIEEAATILKAGGIPCTRVNSARDITQDVHANDQQYFVDVPTPDDMTTPSFRSRNQFALFSDTPGSVKKAPTLGSSNHEILSRYDLSPEEIDALESEWTRKYQEKQKK